MQNISLIVAVDENNGIGINNQLLWHLPADLAHFKQLTLGKPIIMGKNTYLSIGRPLPKRTNIVITHDKTPIQGVIISDDIRHILTSLENEAEIMVIGGASIYRACMPLASKIYLTKVHHCFAADTFFPTLTNDWEVKTCEMRKKDAENPYDMSFLTLIRKSAKEFIK
jgi:dihydrofolate reductase